MQDMDISKNVQVQICDTSQTTLMSNLCEQVAFSLQNAKVTVSHNKDDDNI